MIITYVMIPHHEAVDNPYAARHIFEYVTYRVMVGDEDRFSG